ncbi:M23 family metallopeptidase [Alcaligenaceae bacterium]|uniref:M23 family metallopeptidase n=1 Tax=Pusillimonas sp. (strain T7-7) TaxID=1007105 RepID=UPI0009FBB7F3|nr:M23 family metallopeptidase [Pusillimonas sp. T7-7]NYT60666.1 M23 family metallopeptidase [Alcaligenaceae bacterium]
MSWNNAFFTAITQQRSLHIVGLILLSTSAFMAPIAFAEVLSFSVINEQFRFPEANTTAEVPRVERLRKAFLPTPIKGIETKISSNFGIRLHPVLNKPIAHKGVDYSAPKGTPIRTTADGTIAFIGRKKGYGKVIIIEHAANFSTLYAHQSRFAEGLKKGGIVPKGKTIGYVGSTGMVTGNNLHYEVRVDDQPINPLEVDRLLVENEYFFDNVN